MDNNTEILIDNNNRFEMQKGEVEFLDDNGQGIKGNLKEYFEQQKQANVTYEKKLNIGDVVKLKRTGQVVVVQYVDYRRNDYVKADYAGMLYGVDSANLILFGQEDIELKYNIIDDEKDIKKR